LIYYVRQPNGLPHDLVDGHGRLVGGGTFSSFGLALAHVGETTDVRALGQLADEETGLFYNRYRYYDPTLGRFISHDPIGMDGGSNTYAYGPNPVGWVDPLGLHRINVEGAPQGLNGTYESRDRGGKAENGKGGAGTVDCSERQLIEALRGEPKGSMKGSTIKVTGGLPPCPGCHAAMQKFASEEGSPTITYEWEDQRGGKNKITYPVGPGGGSVEGPITKSKDENDKKFVKQYSSGGDVGMPGYKSAAANASTPAGPPAGAPPTRGPGVPPPPPPEDKGKSGKKKKK
jgi:RHS repeat-associated protein